MVECIFTIDYEIFGDGRGTLRKHVYEPAMRLADVFRKHNARFVVFVEVVELEAIERNRADPAIDQIREQVRVLFNEGFEIGLHIHPWWCNSSYQNGKWSFDYGEFNLCALPKERIAQIVGHSISYLCDILKVPDFVPLSFRAGHLLFNPSATLSEILAEHGIRVDSSVYKGGFWRKHGLDYREALKNGYYWNYSDRITDPDPNGNLLEFPIYTQMVPFWKMLSSKRVSSQLGISAGGAKAGKFFGRCRDFLRLRYPLKLDLGLNTPQELTRAFAEVSREDLEDPSVFRPVVVLAHTKDLIEPTKADALLSHLAMKGISITRFQDIYRRCSRSEI